MISGIGVDIVQVNRIKVAVDKLGYKFAHRILSEREFVQYQQKKQAVHFLAKRFAAKEAVSKALGTGIGKGIRWQDISVINDADGKPSIVLSGGAATMSSQRNIKHWHLSLSDEREHVLAFVIAEGI